ncbi:DUF2786 domain-containing protein [Dactylosporangium matsuzakiense]|uniref:DUF2786 domain-containing protein n=1 Tax=Dactylosporangium matsuzakiense TaxID=53360 RepID=A0A9W6KM87_9ACTN|nr:DUF2786 domain-containing protein [Dactylosporangium matsuzakiense]UWZ43162.1 DUF2786 domain-containing protein [Dactylosporangium matsuzakiense]GLL02750.1 hypothetical protein GCM10017581_044920 [Dactylosporangium matsuzakiense]
MNSARRQIEDLVRGAVPYESGLDLLAVAPAAEVDPALFAAVTDATGRLWRGGWQPAELHRAVVRRGGTDRPVLGLALIDAVAAHLRGHDRRRVDERWLAQADELGAAVWWSADERYVSELTVRRRRDRISVVDDLLGLLMELAQLPAIEVIVPFVKAPTAVAASRVDQTLLNRVRALLAKAESTSYPAEAETYTAKAQELVARHAIDEALLAGRGERADVVPFARRIGVDHPYEGEKASLLSAVAEANRCHTVWSPELGFTTVFGFDADIDAVELLYTSLLVQAGRAMARTEPPGGKAGRARLKTFRQSFLVAYAVRIGERLARATELALEEASDKNVLPVLRSRDEQVRETMTRIFPRTVRGRGSRVDSLEGWESGREAADQAVLN